MSTNVIFSISLSISPLVFRSLSFSLEKSCNFFISFGVKEQLAAVRLYVQMHRTDGVESPVRLQTNFPKKVFVDEDYDNSLENLGLVPSAVLMVMK